MPDTTKSAESILSPVGAADTINGLWAGEKFVYFTGDLALERAECSPDTPDRRTERALKIEALAQYMLRQGVNLEFCHGNGQVILGDNRGHLTQRRLGPHRYQYIFTKKGKS